MATNIKFLVASRNIWSPMATKITKFPGLVVTLNNVSVKSQRSMMIILIPKYVNIRLPLTGRPTTR